MTDVIFRSRRVVTPGATEPASIHVTQGRITAIESFDTIAKGVPMLDAGNGVILPGLVDTHVHVNEPGRTEWEGFSTATRAAAAGGITALLDMPLNSVPATTTVAALETKRAAAEEKVAVDVGFIGGVVPGNAGELASLKAAGVLAFKCFLIDSGVPEFEPVTEPDLRLALPILAGLGVPLMVHCELPGPLQEVASLPVDDPRLYRSWLARRPAAAEIAAVELVCRLAGEFGAWIHVVHLSNAGSLPVLARARAAGVKISCETCPHYLSFAAEEIADGATEFKCSPAIGSQANRERLWEALASEQLDLIVSDHSPCPPAMKQRETGDFFAAWGGISSLQLGLSAVWTGARSRGLPLERLARWMSQGPARLAGLEATKGAIALGKDADLVIFHPEEEFVVDGAALRHRHHLTPYQGRRLAGVVEATYLRGAPVYRRGAPDFLPSGHFLQPLPA